MEERIVMNANAISRQGPVGPGFVNILVGIWLVCSPFVLGFSRNAAAMWSNIGVGIAVILITVAGQWRDGAFEALVVPIAIWLFASPFILGVSTTSFLANNVSLAFVVIATAAIGDGLRSPAAAENSDAVPTDPH